MKNKTVTVSQQITMGASFFNDVRTRDAECSAVINTLARAMLSERTLNQRAEAAGLHVCDLCFSPFTNGKDDTLKPNRGRDHADAFNEFKRASFNGLTPEQQAHVKRGEAMSAKDRREAFSDDELKQFNDWRARPNNFLGRLGRAIAKIADVEPLHKQEAALAKAKPLNQEIWEVIDGLVARAKAMQTMEAIGNNEDHGMALAALMTSLDDAKKATNYVAPAEVK
jgi:hypothetical protein